MEQTFIFIFLTKNCDKKSEFRFNFRLWFSNNFTFLALKKVSRFFPPDRRSQKMITGKKILILEPDPINFDQFSLFHFISIFAKVFFPFLSVQMLNNKSTSGLFLSTVRYFKRSSEIKVCSNECCRPGLVTISPLETVALVINCN